MIFYGFYKTDNDHLAEWYGGKTAWDCDLNKEIEISSLTVYLGEEI